MIHDPNFTYYGKLVRIIDGDTYIFDLDLGFRSHYQPHVRLRGIDVYEHDTPKGQEAIAWVTSEIMMAKEIVVDSYHRDIHKEGAISFERWVCDVWLDGDSLADLLRSAGFEKSK